MEYLTAIRKFRGLSMQQLAKKMSCSPNSIDCWEKGRFYPKFDQVLMLCSALDCTPNDLCGIFKNPVFRLKDSDDAKRN